MFSKRICDDFFDCWHKSRKMKCFESSHCQKECFESEIEWRKVTHLNQEVPVWPRGRGRVKRFLGNAQIDTWRGSWTRRFRNPGIANIVVKITFLLQIRKHPPNERITGILELLKAFQHLDRGGYDQENDYDDRFTSHVLPEDEDWGDCVVVGGVALVMNHALHDIVHCGLNHMLWDSSSVVGLPVMGS